MTRRAVVTLLSAVALWAGGYVSEATATKPCNPKVCSEEIAAACPGLKAAAFNRCRKDLIANCRSGVCSCTEDPTLPACGPTTTTTVPATTTTTIFGTTTTSSPTTTTTIFGTTTTTTTIPLCTFLLKWGVPSGTGNGQLRSPFGVATDGSGNVYVADSGNDRIQKFDASGTFLTTWGSFGFGGDGQFNSPAGVATDGSGNVYVADSRNNRIQKFTCP